MGASFDPRGRLLLTLSRGWLEHTVAGRPEPVASPEPWLLEPGAVFVTLRRRDGDLRGCVGSLRAVRPLAEDVRDNTVAAATRDPRFPPVAALELAQLEVEISLLSSPEPLAVTGEADALSRLRPGVDGVVLTWGRRRATFLPQVWEQLPDPASFLAHLKHKAGLPLDFWAPDLRLERYGVEKWREADLAASEASRPD